MANQTGGYDYEFVHTPSDTLICQICHYPSKEPHLSLCCGHTFCRSCLEAAKRVKSVSNACPVCRNEEYVTVFNKQADRIIRSLHVYCYNIKKGCKWQGEINAITSHINNRDGCQFQRVYCQNNCGMIYQRRYQTIHVKNACPCRKVNCQYCHDTGEHQFIEGQHKKECPKFPLTCPNHCNVGIIFRKDMDMHRRVCPMVIIDCFMNCGKTLERWYLNTHVKTYCPCRKVNCQYCHDRGERQFIEGLHKKLCPKLPQLCPNYCKVNEIARDEIEEHISICPLQIIKCKYHVVGCDAVMVRKDQNKHNKEMMEEHLSLSVTNLAAKQHNTQSIIHDLTQKLATANKEIAALKQQLVMLTDNDKVLCKAKMRFQLSITEQESTQQSFVIRPLHLSFYLDAASAESSTGIECLPVLLKMKIYTEKKQQNKAWFSVPFYTHLTGYKMQLVIFSNDVNNSGSCMGLFLQLLSGPFDEELLWPMRGEFKVTLVDQGSNSMNRSVICSILCLDRKNISNCYCKAAYISHKVLTATNFLEDNNMYFQVYKGFSYC